MPLVQNCGQFVSLLGSSYSSGVGKSRITCADFSDDPSDANSAARVHWDSSNQGWTPSDPWYCKDRRGLGAQ